MRQRTPDSLVADTEADDAIAQHRETLMARFPLPAATTVVRAHRTHRTRRRAGGAVLAVAVLGGLALWVDPVYRTDHLQTAVGQQLHAELADGSQLVLNTATSLDVEWRLRSRQVKLHAGQALFDVEHKVVRPFVVLAGDTRVTVVGTRFEVWRQPASVRVTVLRGRVEVQAGVDGEPAYLGPDQQLLSSGQHLSAPERVDAAGQTVWQDGKLVFERTPLREALLDLQRYSKATIAPVGADIGALRVSGVFDTARADTMLDLLPSILPVTVTRRADGSVQVLASGRGDRADR